jgi:hypothetical protein
LIHLRRFRGIGRMDSAFAPGGGRRVRQQTFVPGFTWADNLGLVDWTCRKFYPVGVAIRRNGV